MLEILFNDKAAARAAQAVVLPIVESFAGKAGRSGGESLVLTPGLFMSHLHPECVCDAGELYQAGVTSWTLAAYAQTVDEMIRSVGNVLETPLASEGGFRGLYLEGPFIGEGPKVPAAKVGEFLESVGAGVSAMVFSPERVEIELLSAVLRHKGVEGIVGYTKSDYKGASRAFEAGAHGLCLPFIAAEAPHHRKPGALGAAAVSGADVEMPVYPGGITQEQMRLLAKAFRGRMRLAWHPGIHSGGTLGRGLPSGLAAGVAKSAGLSVREFLSEFSGRALEGTFVLFDECLNVLCVQIEGELKYVSEGAKP